jgi:hypothetical protein
MRLIGTIAVAAVSAPPAWELQLGAFQKAMNGRMTEGASNWASSGALRNMPNAASNWRAKRHHEEARRQHQTEPPPIPPHRRREISINVDVFRYIGFGRATQRPVGQVG